MQLRKVWISLLVATGLVTGLLAGQLEKVDNPRMWTDRLLPLPQKVKIDAFIRMEAGKIKLQSLLPDAPQSKTALWVLEEVAKQDCKNPEVLIKIALLKNKKINVPDKIAKRLPKLPNSEQAYAIYSSTGKNPKLIINIVANTPVGALYGARTLRQLIQINYDLDEGWRRDYLKRAEAKNFDPHTEVMPVTEMNVPKVEVVDWPDIRERGVWRWCVYPFYEIQWYSRWKLNYVATPLLFSWDGKTELYTWKNVGEWKKQIPFYRDLLKKSEALGIKREFFLSHIKHAMVTANKFASKKDREKYKSTMNVTKSGKRIPGICPNSKLAGKVYRRHMENMAELLGKGKKELTVWLTEDYTQCYCPKCKGERTHLQETKMLIDAWKDVKKKYPDLKLRVGTSQGSRPVNGKIAALAKAKKTGICFYDSALTYTPLKNPMIIPEFEKFAAEGGELQVIPQMQGSWFTTVPGSCPQLVKLRCEEFFKKKVSTIIGYYVPSPLWVKVNCMAMAEWSWNAKGRNIRSFARAYAKITGICSPVIFEQWLEKIGNAGWELAISQFAATLAFKPQLGFYGEVNFDHRFALTNEKMEKFQVALKDARDAMTLARKSGNTEMLNESVYVLNFLKIYKLVNDISDIFKSEKISPEDAKKLAKKLDTLDVLVAEVRINLQHWGMNKRPEGLANRLRHILTAMYTLCDTVRELSIPYVADAMPECRLHEIYEWKTRDFVKNKARPKIDITKFIDLESGGHFYIDTDKIAGFKVKLYTMKVYSISPDGKKQLIGGLSDGIQFDVPPLPEGYRVEIEPLLVGRPKKNEKISRGTIYLRRVWREGEVPCGRKSKPVTGKSGKQVDVKPLPPQSDGKIRVGIYPAGYADKVREVLKDKPGMVLVPVSAKLPVDELNKIQVLVGLQMLNSRPYNRAIGRIRQWVLNGGGIVCYHFTVGFRSFQALFKSTVGAGAGKPKFPVIKIVKGHPVTKGVDKAPFRPAFEYDCLSLFKGDQAEILAVDENNQPVIVAGKSGKGKVVLNGMLLGMVGGKTNFGGRPEKPSGNELKLTLNTVNWLGENFKGK